MTANNILSLFDGMSCGQIALTRAGIEYDNYIASEIDKYAIQVTQNNYPETKQLGDVTNWRQWQGIDWTSIKLLLAGSPCQGFSMAGNKLAFDDPRSKLFFVFVEILDHIRKYNPDVKFILENVKMRKDYIERINQLLGVDAILIDSSLVSAQNRKRLYWTNIEGVTQPDDRNILLPDILEHGVVDRDKLYCIDASYFKGGSGGIDLYIKKARRQIAFTERRTEEGKRIRREFQQLYGRDFSPRRAKELVPRNDGKMNCLTATYSYKEHTLLDEKLYYRMLTPVECERLQTIPDDYSEGVSNTQRYKMIGNGWTVDVIAHILSFIEKGDTMTKQANILYADPPWKYKNVKTGGSMKSGSEKKYPTMTLSQVKAYPVDLLTQKDCVCFLWITSPMIQDGLDVLAAWGFKYKASVYWVKCKDEDPEKGRLGMGFWFRNQTEILLIGIKGKVPAFRCSERNTLLLPAMEHSRKPQEFRDMITRATMKTFDKPVRLELFAREKSKGWVTNGDQNELFEKDKDLEWEEK